MIDRGISFGDIHSYYDLNLILSKVEIPPALPKTSFVDIPGGDGTIDLTEVHGEVRYNDRQCKFTFTMNPSGDLSDSAFEEKKTEISNLLNGLTCKITLDKDADFYYQGRCEVNQYLSDRRIRQIVVNARVKPYKLKKYETVESFDLTSEGEDIILMNSRKTVVPEITCTNDNTTIVFDNVEYPLNTGTHQVLNIALVKGKNELHVSGSGTITFKYQEGVL